MVLKLGRLAPIRSFIPSTSIHPLRNGWIESTRNGSEPRHHSSGTKTTTIRTSASIAYTTSLSITSSPTHQYLGTRSFSNRSAGKPRRGRRQRKDPSSKSERGSLFYQERPLHLSKTAFQMEWLAATWTNPSEPIKDTEILQSLDSSKWRNSSGTLEEIPMAKNDDGSSDSYDIENPLPGSSKRSSNDQTDSLEVNNGENEALPGDGILNDPKHTSDVSEPNSIKNAALEEPSDGPHVNSTGITEQGVEKMPGDESGAKTETDDDVDQVGRKVSLEMKPQAETNDQEENDEGLATKPSSIPWWASRKRRTKTRAP